jgi:ELWxxDGT repeat protein
VSRNVCGDCLRALTLCLALVLAASAAAQPATRLKDIDAGLASSFPFGFQELSGNAFFLASSTTLGMSDLWRTDGTEAGTTRVVQTGVGALSGLAATSRRLFWLEGSAGGPSGPCGECPGPWLVSSDGTQAGTAPVPVPPGLSPAWFGGESLAANGEQVFFFAGQGGTPGLWRADGTAGGTQPLAQFTQGAGSLGPLLAFHEGVVFLLRPLGGNTELWRSDGTASGTVAVKTLSSLPPTCWKAPRRVGSFFAFLADDGSTGCNLWRSDGTAAGTVPLGVFGGAVFLGSARGVLVFSNLTDLWRTDGSAAGTFLLKSFPAAVLSPGVGTREGVYFAVHADTAQQLWITDGTIAGTVQLHDFKANGEDATVGLLTAANGRLLATIRGNVDPFPTSLWTSDGTPSGTVPVQQGVSARGPGFPYRGTTLFAGIDPGAGMEPWAMDGTSFAAPVRPSSLSLLAPCRVIDTRASPDFLGGPALVANAPRVFPVGDVCGIPATARAIAANVTVTGATADGLLRLHASDIGAPEASVINFRTGQTRANNVTVALSPDAEFTVRFEASAGTGEVHAIVDVVGWYE